MSVTCPNGHEAQMTWSGFRSGRGCKKCGINRRATNRRASIEQVRQEFADAGFELLENKYIHNMIPMRCRCKNGHESLRTLANLRQGKGCRECMKSEWGKPVRRRSARKATQAFEAEGYTMLGEYVESHIPIPFVCPNGHTHQISWSHFKQGKRCRICRGMEVNSGDVRIAFESEGYTLLDEYSSSKEKMRFICPEGHHHSINWDRWSTGTRCAWCSGNLITEENRIVRRISRTVNARIRSAIRNHQRRDIPLDSITSFSGKVAHDVLTVLGDRPKGMHLDHIVPVCFFDLRNKAEIEACWHISNLRWLEEKKNCARNKWLKIKEVQDFNDDQLWVLSMASMRPKKFDRFVKKVKKRPPEINQLNIWGLGELGAC